MVIHGFVVSADLGITGPSGFDQRMIANPPIRADNFANQNQITSQQLGPNGAGSQRDVRLYHPADERETGRDFYGSTGLGPSKPAGTLNPHELNLRESSSGKEMESYKLPDANPRTADFSAMPHRAGDPDLDLMRDRSEQRRIASRDLTGRTSPSPSFSLPKTVENLMDKTISSFIRSDFSRSIITDAIELEIGLSLARILNRDARRFVEQHQRDPDVVDLAVKFNLLPDVPKDPKKGLWRMAVSIALV